MKKKYEQYPDIELINIVLAGKSDENLAFSALFDRYAVKVKSFCKYMVSDRAQAEDIFQETFISFYRCIKSGREVTNSCGYLISAARNLSMKYYRDRKVGERIDFEIPTVDEQVLHENNELFELILQALPKLEENYREAYVMREFQGLTFNEIADICSIPVSSAKSRVYRAQQQIIRILQPYMKDLSKY